MSLAVTCMNCGRSYNLNERYAGQTVRCRDCGAPVQVPTPLSAHPTVPRIEDLLDDASAVEPAARQPAGALQGVQGFKSNQRRRGRNPNAVLLWIVGALGAVLIGGVTAAVLIGWAGRRTREAELAVAASSPAASNAPIANSPIASAPAPEVIPNGPIPPAAKPDLENQQEKVESLLKDIVDVSNRLLPVLQSIKDVPSAESALPQLRQISSERVDLQARLNEFRGFTPQGGKAAEYERTLKASLERVVSEQNRIKLIPGIAGVLPQLSRALTPRGVAGLVPDKPDPTYAKSRNNMLEIFLANSNYNTDNQTFASSSYGTDHQPLLSWRVHLLPYLEYRVDGQPIQRFGDLYQEFHLDEPWDSEHNRGLILRMPPVYANPDLDPAIIEAGMTNYLQPTGDFALFGQSPPPRPLLIKDGPTSTIMLVESNADRAVIWTKPDDFEVDPNSPFNGLGQFRSTGFLAQFADGHVAFIPNSYSPEVLANWFNPRDGKRTPESPR